jgi:carbonic anhydrase/acetyltransferase-like protein (isoleucine patch superfamily)
VIRKFNNKTPNIAKSAFVSEAAYIVGDVEIGQKSSVWPGAVIRGDFGKITIGNNTAIEDNCVIHSGTPSTPIGDVFIGNRVHIGHGAVLNCTIVGDDVLIGMNATILHDVTIGSKCIIGANCLVRQGMKIPDNSFVVGVPGKIKGSPSSDQQWWIKEAHRVYARLSRKYKAEGL